MMLFTNNFWVQPPTSLFMLCLTIVVLMMGCSTASSQDPDLSKASSKEFHDYWYTGKAELTRYSLEQVRYGEVHPGDAVLIFVTEDFLTDKQVKYEGGDRSKAAPILKLNFTKKFFTGIYPYSMMASIFTPVDGSKTLKVTTSSQEWCGHTFSQLNHRKGQYKGKLFSYFQNEGDQEFSINDVMLEDEIWTKIRLNPADLPTGNIQVIPGTFFLRLKHRDFQVEEAVASLEDVNKPELSDQPLKKYKLEYQDFSRTLEIHFTAQFPHEIVAWEERDNSRGENLITKAVKTHQLNSAYWSQNNLKDAHLRKELGLDLTNN